MASEDIAKVRCYLKRNILREGVVKVKFKVKAYLKKCNVKVKVINAI
jgi:hypothetical protein